MSKIYKKQGNGRYKELGEEFMGFPIDGVWLVQNGAQNCILRLSDIKTTPPFFIETGKYIEECAQYLVNKERFSKNGYNFVDVARWAAEFYATKLSEKCQSKLKTTLSKRRLVNDK